MTAPALVDSGSAPTRDPLAELFRAHYAWVWRLIRRLGVHEAHIDDAAQQVFLIANDKLGQIVAGRERAFLAGVAQRIAANARRSAARRKDNPDADEIERQVGRGTPEQLLDLKQRRARLDEWLSAIPDDLRVPFVLFELEGHSLQEIASIAGLPVGTVKTRLRRARTLFLQAADEDASGGEP